MQEYDELVATERGAWVEVDTGAIEANTRRLQQLIGPAHAVFGVVKADGYGHGAVHAAKAMACGGAAALAVATVGEGRRLRLAGLHAPILVLGPAGEDEIDAALALGMSLSVVSPETLQIMIAAAHRTGHTPRAHLKIDTGMHRLGLLPHEVLPLLQAEPDAALLRWEGVFTHFACADEPWRTETDEQIACFEAMLASLSAAGYHFPFVHAANSAGALAFPRARYRAVRAGVALYGASPSDDVPLPFGFQPALSFHTRVVRLADLPANAAVSYGGRYITPGPRRIATIAAGYADGLRRSPAWRHALVCGQRVPIVGRICMDYAMIDVSDVADVTVGDDVVLLGAQGDEVIRAEEVATWLGTSAYEVLTTILPRDARRTSESR